MTLKLNYHVLARSLVVNYDGKTTSLPQTDERYALVLDAIKNGNTELIPSLLAVTKLANVKGVSVVDGVVSIDGAAVPLALANKIKAFHDAGLPLKPIVAFWERLSKNPSYNSRQALYSFIEHNGHPVTEDGKFIAYRSVTPDFKDFHTRKFNNAPGMVCEIPRNLVDDNPAHTCSNGLHVACFSYAVEFGGRDRRLVEVEVDPEDVVCVPEDYNGTKMRVCKFKVLGEVAEESVELYRADHPEKFDALDEDDDAEDYAFDEDDDEDMDDDDEERPSSPPLRAP